MQTPWFYSPQVELGLIGLSEDEALHAVGSLRLEHGAPVVVFNGHGTIGDAVLEIDRAQLKRRKGKSGFGELGVFARVTHTRAVSSPPGTLALIVGGCKGDRLEWLIEKCTELGAEEIWVTVFQRTIVKPGEKHAEKLKRVALEACKQCGRAYLPRIWAGPEFCHALERAKDYSILIADPDPAAPPFSAWLAARPRNSEHASHYVFIGPEGGMTPDELDQLRAAGGHPVRLADHTLRVETAAVAAAAIWANRPLQKIS